MQTAFSGRTSSATASLARRAEHVVLLADRRPSRRSTASSSGGRGTRSVSSGRAARRCRLSYICSGSLPGRSVRPQPSRNSVSPETSRPSTRKHWLPGVWPGVWTSSIVDAADGDRVARRRGRRARSRRCPVVRATHGASSRCTWTGQLDPLEQRGDALDRVAHHRAADVVGVVVRGEHAGDRHAVGLDGVDEVVDGVRRVDEHALARSPGRRWRRRS